MEVSIMTPELLIRLENSVSGHKALEPVTRLFLNSVSDHFSVHLHEWIVPTVPGTTAPNTAGAGNIL